MNRSKECIDNRFTGKQYKQSRGKLILFLLAVPLLLLLSLLLGASGIGIPDPALPAGKAIIGLRVGRMLMGLMVGAALSASGVVFRRSCEIRLPNPMCLVSAAGPDLAQRSVFLPADRCFFPSVFRLSPLFQPL